MNCNLTKSLVQQCLAAQGKAVAPYEAEIDDIVVHLYGLIDVERTIIEGRGK